MQPERTKMLTRSDILRWLSDTTQQQVKRIEDLGDGVCYCLAVSRLCGGKVLAQTAINRYPKTQSDILGNYKQLQAAFTRLKIFRPIEGNRLANMRYQDNWEFSCYLYRILNKQGAKEGQQENTPKRSHLDLMLKKSAFQMHMLKGPGHVTPANGKSSVSSELFSSSYVALIDRLRGILTNTEPDEEKVRQLRLLLNVQQQAAEHDIEIKDLITDEKATVEELQDSHSPKQLKF